jgi:peptidoglycan hydrolase-like protein with peptidoglycan-binding domain
MSDGTQYRYTVRGDQSESADSTNGSGSSFSEIRRGDSGDTVKKIQEKLIELGVLSGSADGQFGPGTESAIAAFQKNNNLEASGVVNEETYNALFSDE